MIAVTMRPSITARRVSLSVILRLTQMLFIAACLLAALQTAKANTTVASADPATVQNVRVSDFYGHSVVLLWDKPTQPVSAAAGGYYVTWAITGQTAFSSKVVSVNAFQLQPLDPAQTYTVTIAALDLLGNLGKALTIPNVSPKGQYEALIKQYTNNGLNGFLYLPENDPVNGRVNPLKINNNFFNLHAGDAGGTTFDHSCVAVNNQQHWHMVANDFGTGSITSRIKARIPVDTNTRALVWDCDAGPTARQTWYIVLTPNKVEQFLLFPNNGDGAASNVYPQEQIQIKFDGVNARFLRYSGGNLVGQGGFNWRGAVYTNVRQIMELNINSQGLTGLADTAYSGVLQQAGTFATDLSGWKSCYAYFTLGSYNNKKTNSAPGVSATGQPMLEFQGGNMHWGNVAIVTPDGAAPPVELSYFQQPDIKQRDNSLDLTANPTLTVTIPDAIPADAVSSELVFTDRDGCIPCLSGTNKLRLSVNGMLLPNKQEAAAWADYPTYRWTVPAGVLKKGANTVTFGQNGTPDAIGVSSVHFDIFVPVTSAAVAAYTPPPADPVLDTMPDHTALEGWTMPLVYMAPPSGFASGTVNLPVLAQAPDTANLAGTTVPFDTVWGEINGAKFWSQDTNAAGNGTGFYSGSAALDTTKYPDGYYDVQIHAHSKSGSQGYSNGSDIYNYNYNRRMLIVNAPANKTAPAYAGVTVAVGSPSQTTSLNPKANYFVRQGNTYAMTLKVQSKNPLVTMQTMWRDTNGVYHPYHTLDATQPASKTTVGANTVYTFNDSETIIPTWGADANGQISFELLTSDVYGNTAAFPYTYSLISTTMTPPPPVTAAPVINGFTVSPQTVTSGWACQLQWYVTGGQTITIDNGVGAVGASGKVCVTPTKTTTYTITATNAKGAVTKSATVTVTP